MVDRGHIGEHPAIPAEQGENVVEVLGGDPLPRGRARVLELVGGGAHIEFPPDDDRLVNPCFRAEWLLEREGRLARILDGRDVA